MDLFDRTIRDIKSIKIQGATNVAKYAVKALKYKAGKIKAKNKKEFLGKLYHYEKELLETRPTEPLMRNSLRYILHVLKESDLTEKKEMVDLIDVSAEEFLFNLEKAKKRIYEIGARTIKNNSIIFTHCRSSTVTGILKEAKKQKKKFEVFCTETRPKFQGRKTAKELLDAKIPTTMIVDSAISSYIRKADMAIVGSDLINAEKSLVNKIGTKYLALACKRVNVPFFCATLLAKFDPETIYGKIEEIETRDTKEIWEKPPKKLKILNPAFDYTPRELINAYITEEGIITPHSIYDIINSKYNWVMKGLNY